MKSSQETVAPDGSSEHSRWARSWYLKTLGLLETPEMAVSSREAYRQTTMLLHCLTP